MKILLVEDEEQTVAYLSRGLSEAGYAVEVASTGVDGLHLALNGDHDLVILDVMIPGIDGFAVLSALRTKRDMPVLMLTARGQTADKVRGLQTGADDYLVKPFQFPELLARLQSLLRRGKHRATESLLSIHDLEIDPIKHRASRNGTNVDLTAREFALLTLLARRKGEVLSRTEIASLVWDINFDSETNVVEVAIKRLRAKIDDPFETKLIRTIRGVGYVLDTPTG